MRSIARLSRINSHFFAARSSPLRASHSHAHSAHDHGVLIEEKGAHVTIVLNRPKALNALNATMVKALTPLYQALHTSKQDKIVVMKGAGEKAFCAGGDIRAIYDLKKAQQPVNVLTQFFSDEYKLNLLIATLPSSVAHVALLNGITMGGGVGLSVHGRFRVANETTVFAMPETAIGFFCDVGGSYFLPRLPRYFGTFLALTGHRLKGADVFHAGVATHFVKASKFPLLENQLLSAKSSQDVEAILASFADPNPPNALTSILPAVERCFSQPTVEQIVEALQKEGTAWSKSTTDLMSKMSPTSMKVVLRQMREGATKPIADCFKMELHMAEEFMRQHDFFEGVRAVIVDKDQKPQWQPSHLAGVTNAAVDKYFL